MEYLLKNLYGNTRKKCYKFIHENIETFNFVNSGNPPEIKPMYQLSQSDRFKSLLKAPLILKEKTLCKSSLLR